MNQPKVSNHFTGTIIQQKYHKLYKINGKKRSVKLRFKRGAKFVLVSGHLWTIIGWPVVGPGLVSVDVTVTCGDVDAIVVVSSRDVELTNFILPSVSGNTNG